MHGNKKQKKKKKSNISGKKKITFEFLFSDFKQSVMTTTHNEIGSGISYFN